MTDKIYYRHSGYPGGLKSINLGDMMERYPTRAIEYAVKGMLPRNKLGVQMLKKLKIYTGSEHPHQSQFKTGAAKKEE
jgi:large subunit ribosomal protein L13